ncbi:MAG TPA: PQQ-binding-like beta-propeller repeat protein [Alphaproteobacteria bacterium]|jgi:outer membrane protein assembly factor BamB|nr:PQQ-binding-like beta-propeller repeat protein [Alphaproteobacteria bacterium]
MYLKKISLLFVLLVLSSCGWFGEREQPPLPGTRIEVLQNSISINPDPALAGQKIILSSAANNSDWTQLRVLPTHNPPMVSFDFPLQQIWRANIGLGESTRHVLLMEPIVNKQMVFVVNGNLFVSAIDLTSGRIKWRMNLKTLGEKEEFTGAALGTNTDGSILFVTTPFGKIYALNSQNGNKLWEQYIASPIHSAPVVSSKKIFITTMDSKLFVLEQDTGKLLWDFKGAQENPTLFGSSAVAVTDDIVVVAFNSGEIAGLKTDNGQLIWSDAVGTARRGGEAANINSIKAAVVVDGDIVFIINHNTLLVALDLKRGIRIWEAPLGSTQTPWVSGQAMFLISDTNQLVALERSSGRIFWLKSLNDFLTPEQRKSQVSWFGPIISREGIIVGNSLGEILVINVQDHQLISKYQASTSIALAPIVTQNIMLILSKNGTISAFR